MLSGRPCEARGHADSAGVLQVPRTSRAALASNVAHIHCGVPMLEGLDYEVLLRHVRQLFGMDPRGSCREGSVVSGSHHCKGVIFAFQKRRPANGIRRGK